MTEVPARIESGYSQSSFSKDSMKSFCNDTSETDKESANEENKLPRPPTIQKNVNRSSTIIKEVKEDNPMDRIEKKKIKENKKIAKRVARMKRIKKKLKSNEMVNL